LIIMHQIPMFYLISLNMENTSNKDHRFVAQIIICFVNYKKNKDHIFGCIYIN